MARTAGATGSASTEIDVSGTGIAPHHYPQLWFIIVSFASFGAYVAWDLNYLSIVFVLDRSHLTAIIAVLVLLSSGHAAWHIFVFSRRIEAARDCLGAYEDSPRGPRDDGYIALFVRELKIEGAASEAGGSRGGVDSVVEIFADRLRSPVGLGWFLVDLAIRLGLVGTIIGFVLIFTSLSGSDIAGAEGLRDLLISMSGGMGTALFTTLSGLVGGILLSLQYLVLGREAEYLIGLLVRIRNRQSLADS